jgi:FdrA protein
MLVINIVRKNSYHDSVFLMSIATAVKKGPGVEEVSCLMGTQENKRLLQDSGLLKDEGGDAAAGDLVIAVRARKKADLEAAIEQVEELLAGRIERTSSGEHLPRSLESALDKAPDSNMAFISLPGPYVRREGEKALLRDLNLFIFSDNVSVEDELALKKLGRERGLMVMGPDCGTAIIDGIAVGFANVVRRGFIGIVAAAGTGLQEVACLIDREGAGVSQAIGTGGRDLSQKVGGITMLEGIKRLNDDPASRVICLISKPPDPEVAQNILAAVEKCSKPVVVNFLGSKPDSGPGNAYFCSTLEQAAYRAVSLSRREETHSTSSGIDAETMAVAEALGSALARRRRFVRGLYSGGTLCEEGLIILTSMLGPVWSNVPMEADLRLEDSQDSQGHTVVDLGDDEFTKGRPHPMIDFELRNERIIKEAKDRDTAVILLDVVLGYGAHPSPAEALAPAIEKATDRDIAVVASVTGTPADPQGFYQQKKLLNEMGAAVMPSNAQAARFAALVARRGDLRSAR